MFRAGEIWRHAATLDMDLYIVKVSYVGASYTKCRVRYLNRRTHNLFVDGVHTVQIKRDDFYRWRKV